METKPGDRARDTSVEADALRRRVADLEAQIETERREHDALRASEARLRVSEEQFRTLAAHLPVGVFQTDAKGDCVYVNERWQEITGLTREEALGPNWSSTLHPEDRDSVYGAWYDAARSRREFVMEYRFLDLAGTVRWVSGRAVAMRDASGEILGYFGTITEITERKQAAELLRESTLQKELLRMQEAALAQLSTPLIPISDTIMAMPLIGVVDARRAQRVLETLLEGVTSSGARVTILDITGVSHMDTHVADALLRTAHAVKLVGAQMVLSGIGAEVARTLVALEIDLTGIVTCGTLQSAIAYAMRVT